MRRVVVLILLLASPLVFSQRYYELSPEGEIKQVRPLYTSPTGSATLLTADPLRTFMYRPVVTPILQGCRNDFILQPNPVLDKAFMNLIINRHYESRENIQGSNW